MSCSVLDDFLNYALYATREHHRTFKRIKELNASYLEDFVFEDIFQQGFETLCMVIKTKLCLEKFSVKK